MEFTLTFMKLLLVSLGLTAPILSSLAAAIVVIGQVVGWLESWKKFDALYWSFITATTVGYGDIRPTRRISKALAVIVAFTGLVFTGIIVAQAIFSATHAFNKHVDLKALKIGVERIGEAPP